ncbi:MAG: HEAT repeat domain-containing protein [Planctomycetes bacterium]|nr:HEAT repeat domain-containing protein [Planctomycetota bacterium]
MGLLAALACLAFAPQEEKLDDSKIKSLIELLGADFLEEREPARKSLEQAGKTAEPRLVEALSHADHRVRRSCLELLTLLKSTAALKRSSELFTLDDDPTVREAAFRLLQSLAQDGEDALIAALASPQVEFRRGAIQSLAGFRSQKCVGKIAELYDREPDKTVKEAAWRCLLSLGKASEPYLLKYLGDADAGIRKDALSGLRGSQDDQTLAAVAKLFDQETEEAPLHQASEFLQRAGLRAEPAYLSGLKNPRPQTRLKSVQGLKAIKSEKALEAVAEVFLGDSPPDVRGASADYLKSQGLRAEAALMRGLQSGDSAIRLASIQVLGEIGSEKALERVGRIFREEKNREIHEKSFDFLKKLGIRAENDLLGALADEDKEIRKQAVFALGDAQSERAIPRLIDFMTELDPAMKEASEVALASIGRKAIDEVGKAVEGGRLKKAVADAIDLHYTRGEVERILEAQFGDDDSTGFYEGQFKDLEVFGKEKAVPVLIQILNDRSYVFRRIHRRERPDKYRDTMKELSVMALGEFGGDGVLQALKTFLADERQQQFLARRVREETLVALYRLGEKKLLDDHLREARKSADRQLQAETSEQKEEGCDQLFSLGLLFNRLKRYPEAAQAYHELIAAIEKFKLDHARERNLATTYYNLACLSSQSGDRAKGVEWLEMAVKAGFIDRAWIRKDRDLDAIREEAGFKKLLADDRLFEKRPEEAPPADK